MHHDSNHRGASKSKQFGAGTLLTSVVVLMLATLIVLAVSKTILTEQRLSGNEVRSRAAFEAAEAGLNFAVTYIETGVKSAADDTPATAAYATGAIMPVGIDKNNDNTPDQIPVKVLTSGKHSYAVAFCDPTAAISSITCPSEPGAVSCTAPSADNFVTPRIASCGWSDDGLGKSLITQSLGTANSGGEPPKNPMTAKGAVNVTGSASVTNEYTNLTVWTGSSLQSIGAAGKTFVRNPTAAFPSYTDFDPDMPNTCSTTDRYVCLTTKDLKGPDVIDSDPTLSALSDDELFAAYFGLDSSLSSAALMNDFKSRVMTHPELSSSDFLKLKDSSGPATILINGNLTDTFNGVIGGASSTTDTKKPITLVIDGDWSPPGGGNLTIYGFVYVRGNLDLKANITVFGGVTVEGTVTGSGSLDVYYKPYNGTTSNNFTTKPGVIPGSWRDFK